MGALNTTEINVDSLSSTTINTNTINITGNTVTSGLTVNNLTVLNTGATQFINAFNDEIIINNGNGTSAGIQIHQSSFLKPKIIDVFNQDYSLRHLYIYDDGVTGLVTLANNTVSIDTYANSVSIPSGSLYIKAKTTLQDFVSFAPLLGSGGIYFNSNSESNPYFYLQNSAGTTTNVSISSSGDSYFNGGNIGVGVVAPSEKLSIQNGNLALQTIGSKLIIAAGTNASIGIVTLTAGTVTVNNTLVTNNSIILLTIQGGTLTNIGSHYISARVANTSFTITSTNILDSSNVGWLIIEPS
jgi:hypothetical protein